MCKSLSILILSGITSMLMASSLFAQDQSRNRAALEALQQRVVEMDKNKDGKITRQEATGLLKANFDRVDENSDGFVEPQELARTLARAARGGQNRSPEEMSDERLKRTAPEGVTIEPNISYRPGKSKAWRLDLIRPTELGDSPRPAIVFIHGGGWRSGDKRRGFFLSGAQEYAQAGYVCITVNYRLVGEAPFPACIEDVKCAVRWLRANAKKYNIDPNRIGGYGNSAGAHLVAMLGLADPDAKLEGDGPHRDQSSKLQAVCCSATPTNMLLFERLLSPGRTVFPGSEEEIRELARRSSPITYVNDKAPPFLVVHGTTDGTVNIEHGDTFVDALKESGAEYVEYIRIDGAGHGVFGQHSDRNHKAMKAFFAKHLKQND